jgi:hypothetical protein
MRKGCPQVLAKKVASAEIDTGDPKVYLYGDLPSLHETFSNVFHVADNDYNNAFPILNRPSPVSEGRRPKKCRPKSEKMSIFDMIRARTTKTNITNGLPVPCYPMLERTLVISFHHPGYNLG